MASDTPDVSDDKANTPLLKVAPKINKRTITSWLFVEMVINDL